MKKILILLTTIFTTNAFANEAAVNKILHKKYPQLSNVEVKKLPEAGLYHMNIAGQNAYTDEKVSYVLVGGELLVVGKDNVVKNLTKTLSPEIAVASSVSQQIPSMGGASQITPQIPTPTLPASFSDGVSNQKTADPRVGAMPAFANLPFDKAIKQVFGKGERIFVAFADPDCPYCQDFEKNIQLRGNAVNATVYTFIWPLNIHPNAPEKADYLWCAPDKEKAWASWMFYAANAPKNLDEQQVWNSWKQTSKRPAKYACKTPSPKDDIIKIARGYNFNVTPTFMFQNGMVFNGYLDLADLEKALNISKEYPKGVPQ